MNIGQYTDSFLPIVDGVGRVVFSYAETLGKLGHSSYVFAPMAQMGYLGDYHFQVVDYNTVSMPGKKLPYRVGVPALDPVFEKRVKMIELDLVHVHSPFMMGYSGLRLAKKRKLPIVGTFHSKYYDDFSQVLKLDSLARMGVKQVVDFFSHCDEVWAVSEASAGTLAEYGFKGEIVVMPNGTELRRLDESVLPELKQIYAIEEDVPLLLYVGQLNWKKNIRRIFEAAKRLKEWGLSFRMLIAGQGPHREEMIACLQALDIGDRVSLIGHITQTKRLDGLYALATLLVFPSLYDNAPMVLREAAAMHTPAVLIRGSTAAECVQDGINGVTCEDDASALAGAIQRVLEDKAHAVRMGQAAYDTIPKPWEDILNCVAERYCALVERKDAQVAR